MSTHDDDFDYEDLDDVTPDDPQPEDETPKGLRRAAAAGKQAKAEAATLRRENAMLKAGVDTDSPQGQMFADAYKGDLTTDAIKASFNAIFPNAANTPTTDDTDPADPDEPVFSAEEIAATTGRQQLANGAPASGMPETGDPVERMHAVYEAEIARGGRSDVAAAAGISALIASRLENPNR